jgi:hypothetical protein
LIGDHEYSLEGESSSAFVELILETGTKEVHHHEVVGILSSEVVYFSESRGVLEFTVDFVFVAELWTAGSMLFKLDCHLFPITSNPKINITETTSTDPLGNPVFGNTRLHIRVYHRKAVW